MKIKICGLSRREDIDFVNKAGPDYVGFVFAKSKRQVTIQEAAILRKTLHPNIIPVGVFVNEEIPVIRDIFQRGIIDIVQLHGKEDRTYIESLRNQLNGLGRPYQLIKAISVEAPSDLEGTENLPVDYLLLDKAGGGTGQTFNWKLLDCTTRWTIPFFLAGGLNSSNLAEAIRTVNPFGIDVSSGVETNGKKDSQKILDLISSARRLEKQK